ncbi:MAG: hypothetical protein QGH39_07765 [Candidatus Thermoplasmatota archaeon]|jgi:hypothetical protein|nr:hypothetical protein [Candidatus Thermoplasmatota archaeon]
MVKWYYFLAVQILMLFLVFIALASPWYSMEHNVSGSLSSGTNVFASGTMFTGESMSLKGRNWYHGATSSPQIFRQPLTDNGHEDYEDMPHVKETMGTAGLFSNMVLIFCIIGLAMLAPFLFIKGIRKHLKIAMIINGLLLVFTTAAVAIKFNNEIPPALSADLENTVYPHIFDHMTMENLTVPAQASGQYENFHTTRDAVYERFSNGTVYEETFSGSSVETYNRDYSALGMKLRVSSVLLWHPSMGWYLMLSLLLPGLAAVFFAFRLDTNMVFPFSLDKVIYKSHGKRGKKKRRSGKKGNRSREKNTDEVTNKGSGVESSNIEEGFLPVPESEETIIDPEEGFISIGGGDDESEDFPWNR